VLEGTHIKLSSVATDILGVSGRLMLNAILDGVDNPEELTGLAKRRMKSKKEDLERALFGSIGFHQKMMLKVQFSHIDFLDLQIAMLNDEV
jgi:transposase